MKKHLIILWFILSIMLSACSGEIQTTTDASTAEDTSTQPPSHPYETPTLALTPPTDFDNPAKQTETANTCVPIVSGISLPEDIFLNPEFETVFESYLNAGGSIRELPAAIKVVEGGTEAKIQVISADLGEDNTPDVFLSVTLPYGNGDGETHLLFFQCKNGSYQGQVLFRRAGAGSLSDGLYDGGGARVVNIKDFNNDGKIDVMISVNWKDYKEYYLVTYDGTQFNNLLSYRDELGERVKKIRLLDGDLKIVDIDGDGIYEIVTYGADGKVQQVWRWDGKYYSFPQKQ